MKNSKTYFRCYSNHPLKLSKVPTYVDTSCKTDLVYENLMSKNQDAIGEYQTLLYANRKQSMLIIFQGMDTAGKDGAIKHVMSGVNPQGCSVFSFKTPNSSELNHDFLWRANQVLPSRGQIGIFNRSYYEEVLVTRVHPELIESERLPIMKRDDSEFWRHRYQDIVNYEKYLHRQGYEIVKIFIHISKNEQKHRLIDRFQNPKKLWKISEGDVRERSFWKDYQFAYEECIRHTASNSCPWYVVPGDDKKNARLSISEILVDRFERLKLTYPKLTQDEKNNLKKIKAALIKK